MISKNFALLALSFCISLFAYSQVNKKSVSIRILNSYKKDKFILLIFNEKLIEYDKEYSEDVLNQIVYEEERKKRDAISKYISRGDDYFKNIELISPNTHFLYILKKYKIKGSVSYSLYMCKKLPTSINEDNEEQFIVVEPNASKESCFSGRVAENKLGTEPEVEKNKISNANPNITYPIIKLKTVGTPGEKAYLYRDLNLDSSRFYFGKAYDGRNVSKLEESPTTYMYSRIAKISVDKIPVLIKVSNYERRYRILTKNRSGDSVEGWIQGRFVMNRPTIDLTKSNDVAIRTIKRTKVFENFDSVRSVGYIEKNKIRFVFDHFELKNVLWYKIRYDSRFVWVNSGDVLPID